MILQAFRKHLADELERFPADPERAFESYAVTTTTLARRILDYLAIDDLAVSNGFDDDPPEYPLRTVLDRIIHFQVLHPDHLTFSYPGKPDLVTLYSDRTQDDDKHQYIRLREYIEVTGRLANDDPYVALHLFRRAVTQLYKVMNTRGEPAVPREEIRQADFRKRVSRMVGNAWSMLVRLVESGDVTCPKVAVECYERRYGNGAAATLAKFPPISTCRDLMGDGPAWRWAPFTPRKEDIDGRDRYCMLLTAVAFEAERTACTLVVTFDSYIRIFQDARRQLDGR